MNIWGAANWQADLPRYVILKSWCFFLFFEFSKFFHNFWKKVTFLHKKNTANMCYVRSSTNAQLCRSLVTVNISYRPLYHPGALTDRFCSPKKIFNFLFKKIFVIFPEILSKYHYLSCKKQCFWYDTFCLYDKHFLRLVQSKKLRAFLFPRIRETRKKKVFCQKIFPEQYTACFADVC